jgi:rRNA pseudouridine-1189 N-methylase Emg1 (Nep1/Mra1 family)
LINGSIHQHLLKDVPLSERYDRPDILHFGLLLTLNLMQEYNEPFEIYFQLEKHIYQILPDTKLPRDQQRFYGIIEQLIQNYKPSPYIKRLEINLNELIKEDQIILFDIGGETTIEEIDPKNLTTNNTTIVYGAFAHGELTKSSFVDTTGVSERNITDINISKNLLELWTAISLSLPKLLKL